MHIAQVAPLTEAIPPKLYGGTERVVSWLTEELIALGHEVTLVRQRRFGDFGPLGGGLAAGVAARRRGARSQCAAYDDAGARLPVRVRIRHPALSSRLLSVLAVFTAVDAVRDHAAWPTRPAGASAGVRHLFVGARCLDLEFAAPAAAAGELGAHHLSRAAGGAFGPASRQTELFRIPRPHRAGKGHRSRHPDCAALRRAAQSRRQGRQGRPGLFRRANQAADDLGQRRIYRRDQRPARSRNSSAARSRYSFRSTGRSRSAWS